MTYTAGQRVLSADLNGNTLQLIGSPVVLTGTAATVVIPIPQNTYNHLMVKWKARGDAAVTAQQIGLQIGGVTSNSYLSERNEVNNITSTYNLSLTNSIQVGTIPGSSGVAKYFAQGTFDINGWSDTANYMTVCGTGACFTGSSNGYAGTYGGLATGLPSGSEPTSITLLPNSGNFIAGCLFSVYGLS